MIPKSKDYIEYPYLGPQGETCRTVEALRIAQENYARKFLTYIGPEGRTFSTFEALEATRAEYRRRTFRTKVTLVANLFKDIPIKR